MSGIIFRTVFAVSLAVPSLAIAQNDEPISFEGQTITLIVPSNAGGGTDFQGRLVARHIPKYLPGHPTIVVQNVPGAGGMKAIRYFLDVNPETDLSFTMVHSSLPFRSRSGVIQEAVFDPKEMQWIGSASDNTNFCAFSTDAYDDIEELKEREFTAATQERSGNAYAIYQILIAALDWKIKLISGYENSQTEALAIERGEVDGTCSSMDSYPSSVGPLVKRGIAKLALYMGPHRRDDIDAPYLLDFPMEEEKRKFADTALSSISFGRPFALHPDADPRLLPIFRQAFKATLEDPEFLDEAKKGSVVLRYTSGEEIEEKTSKLYAASNETIAEIAGLIYE